MYSNGRPLEEEEEEDEEFDHFSKPKQQHIQQPFNLH
jgi:hypothetical protein